MATITWYGAGVSSVATGSRTVTGMGTGWLTEVAGLTAIKAGDKYGIHVGRPIVIEKVISDTELLLADNWPGPAQTSAPYKVELTSPTIAAVEAMRRLLVSLSSGNLLSIAEASIGIDDLLIGVGPGVLAPVKKADIGYLFGLSGSTDGSFAVFDGESGKKIKQLSVASALHSLKAVGAYAKDNIRGTVSQNGGVPTGSIFETGANANGTYIRFADGTQICWHQLALNYSDNTDMSAGWTYPASFNENPVIVFSETQFWNNGVRNFRMISRIQDRGSGGVAIISSNPGSNNVPGDIHYIHVNAHGRWF